MWPMRSYSPNHHSHDSAFRTIQVRDSMLTRLLLLTAAVAIGSPASAADPARPNIVVILADDQGWGDLSVNGNTNLRTPHIDSLARDGARFDRFFVQPVCSPTRAEFLTGRWHPLGGVHGVPAVADSVGVDEPNHAHTVLAAG